MAYRKYLKINNKIYGPYIYKSKRVGNKVTTEYVGKHTEQEETKLTTKPNFNFKVLWIIFPILLVLFSALFFVVFYPRFTGRVGLEQEGIVKVELPSIAENISVYKIYGELIEEIEEIKKGTMVEKLEKILALELKIKELKEKFSSLNQDLSELEELEEKLLELKRSLEAGEIEIKGKEREVEITREKLEVIEVKEKVSEENIEIT